MFQTLTYNAISCTPPYNWGLNYKTHDLQHQSVTWYFFLKRKKESLSMHDRLKLIFSFLKQYFYNLNYLYFFLHHYKLFPNVVFMFSSLGSHFQLKDQRSPGALPIRAPPLNTWLHLLWTYETNNPSSSEPPETQYTPLGRSWDTTWLLE